MQAGVETGQGSRELKLTESRFAKKQGRDVLFGCMGHEQWVQLGVQEPRAAERLAGRGLCTRRGAWSTGHARMDCAADRGLEQLVV